MEAPNPSYVFKVAIGGSATSSSSSASKKVSNSTSSKQTPSTEQGVFMHVTSPGGHDGITTSFLVTVSDCKPEESIA